jgi:thiol-disulfide isomerase/thioredoxin
MRFALCLLLFSACIHIERASQTASTSRPTSVPAEFHLTDLSGQAVELSSFQGKVILLNFWASWCEPCHHELPQLEELSQTYQPKGVVFLTINVDEDPAARDKYLKEHPLSLPILLNSDEHLREMFGAGNGLPLNVFIDRDYQISSVKEGTQPRMKQKLSESLDALLAK